MPTVVKVALATADHRTDNGRIYPRQLLERVVQQHNAAITLAYIHDDAGLTMQNAVGQVQHLQLAEDGKLYATIKMADTPRGLAMQELWRQDYRPKFGMSGTGSLLDGVVQDDYRFNGVTVDLNPAFLATTANKLRNIFRRKLKKRYETGRPAEDHRQYPC